MSWLDKAARCSLRLPRCALQAPPLRTRQPRRTFADDPDQRPPSPAVERDVSPSKVRRDAIICPPAVPRNITYRLPPQTPPPQRPPPSRPPHRPPRPATRLDFVRGLRVPSACKRPPPPRSPGDTADAADLCPKEEFVACPKVPGPGEPETKPESENTPSAPLAPAPAQDTCCERPGESEQARPTPIFSCLPPDENHNPCPPPPPEIPCPPPRKPPLLLRMLANLFWWGGRSALAASVVYWTYVYGLWGSCGDTEAIADKWRTAIGHTQQGGSGLWFSVGRAWDSGVKMVFSAVAITLRTLMGPGMGAEPQQQRHQTSEISNQPILDEDDDDDDMELCGCCKHKPPPEDELSG